MGDNLLLHMTCSTPLLLLRYFSGKLKTVRTQVVSQGLLPPYPSRQQGKTCLLQGTFLLPFVADGQAAAD